MEMKRILHKIHSAGIHNHIMQNRGQIIKKNILYKVREKQSIACKDVIIRGIQYYIAHLASFSISSTSQQ